ASVDFPHPDSPTIPTASCGATSSEIPRSACTSRTMRPLTSGTLKVTFSLSTERRLPDTASPADWIQAANPLRSVEGGKHRHALGAGRHGPVTAGQECACLDHRAIDRRGAGYGSDRAGAPFEIGNGGKEAGGVGMGGSPADPLGRPFLHH